jgi:hypothetical protein
MQTATSQTDRHCRGKRRTDARITVRARPTDRDIRLSYLFTDERPGRSPQSAVCPDNNGVVSKCSDGVARSPLSHARAPLSAGTSTDVGSWTLMSTTPRPIAGRPDETPRPGRSGPRYPYPVNDPGFADPNKPRSAPDYMPPPSPAGAPELCSILNVNAIGLLARLLSWTG